MRFAMLVLIALIGFAGCQQYQEKKTRIDDLIARADDDASKIAWRHWTVVSKKEEERLGQYGEKGIVFLLEYDYTKAGLARLTPGAKTQLEVFHSHQFFTEFDELKEGDSIWLLHISELDTWHRKYASAYLAPKCPKANAMYQEIAQGGGY